jgi:hypothetical protein
VVQPYRHLTRVTAGQDCRVGGRNLERDVGPGMRGTDHQHRTRLELLRPAVLAGMQLADRRVEIQCKVRNARSAAKSPSRYDDVVSDDAVIAEPEHVLPVGRF